MTMAIKRNTSMAQCLIITATFDRNNPANIHHHRTHNAYAKLHTKKLLSYFHRRIPTEKYSPSVCMRQSMQIICDNARIASIPTNRHCLARHHSSRLVRLVSYASPRLVLLRYYHDYVNLVSCLC